jgi:methyl-accepting chemotaxis protein
MMMTNLSYNDNEMRVLNNKYQMQKYDPNSQTLNNINTLPQYLSANMSNIINPNQGRSGNILIRPTPQNRNVLQSQTSTLLGNNINQNPITVFPNDTLAPAPNARNFNETQSTAVSNKELLLKESEKIFDEIELYGLIVTNDLVAIKRSQKKISKEDFSLQFYEFRKRLYKRIDKTHDKMINNIKQMKEDFITIKKNVNDNMKVKLKKTKKQTERIHQRFNVFKNNISQQTSDTEVLLNRNIEKIKSLASIIGEFDDDESESSDYGDEN